MKKYVNGEYIDLTEEELAALLLLGQTAAEAQPSQEERIAALEEYNEMLTECILELSQLLYA